MRKKTVSFRANVRAARQLWGGLSIAATRSLQELTTRYSLSVATGDLQLLDGRWYVTYSGLLQLALRRGCQGIETQLQEQTSVATASRWVFKAVVYKSSRRRRFFGYGDADPSNVSPMVRGAEMRVAETRAVNRALRKAYGIGLCSVEELGTSCGSARPTLAKSNGSHGSNGSNGQPRLRDQLCLLIRRYNLDANLVKACAVDFCGTDKLSGASRDKVEAFIQELAKSAKENRDALVCKLNSYASASELTP